MSTFEKLAQVGGHKAREHFYSAVNAATDAEYEKARASAANMARFAAHCGRRALREQ